jgi:hypothetical protein
VLLFGLSGVEFAFATLGAEDREFDADLAQRTRGVVVGLS